MIDNIFQAPTLWFLREARQAAVLESWCLFKSHIKAAHRAGLTIPWNPWQSDLPVDLEQTIDGRTTGTQVSLSWAVL